MERKNIYTGICILVLIIIFSTAAICNSCGLLPVTGSDDGSTLATDNNGSPEESSEKTDDTDISDETDDTGNSNPSDETITTDSPDVSATDSSPDISSDDSVDDSQATESTASGNEAPTINLVIYEGPSYSAVDDICYYRIKADTTGKPKPDIVFNRDDSNGAWGPDKVQINIVRGQTFNLQAKAKNPEGEASDTIVLNWGCGEENRPPVVQEIAISDPNPITNILYGILIDANDPDGDILSYNWTVSSGTLSDNNKNMAIWKTPAIEGDCILTVTVSDGKGHTVNKTKKVKVSFPAPVTVYLQKVVGEGGTVEDAIFVLSGDVLYAGDDYNDKSNAGFVSFDISGLSGAKIQNAAVSFICSEAYGDPLSAFDMLCLNEYYWGPRPIQQQDLFASGNLISTYKIATFGCDAPALKNAIQEKINSGKPRFQLRIYFSGALTDNDHWPDGWMYSQDNIKLKITYIPGT